MTATGFLLKVSTQDSYLRYLLRILIFFISLYIFLFFKVSTQDSYLGFLLKVSAQDSYIFYFIIFFFIF